MILVPSITLVSPSRVRRRPKEATVKLRYGTRFLPELASGYSYILYTVERRKRVSRDILTKRLLLRRRKERLRLEEKKGYVPSLTLATGLLASLASKELIVSLK